ncbi:hypothetical protein [Thiorhodococcus fuscus]|uniref:DUF4435 domain-containing protein n=1 Tax=Thiorhodococcus fuscus TaxID=527200 RepID=A0ABW4Y969_9GAMM
MISDHEIVFLYQKDYAETGLDKYFIITQSGFSEVTAEQIVAEEKLIICHDYWLIAPTLFHKTGKLPPYVVDVDEFQVIISGSKQERRLRDRKDISKRPNFPEIEQQLCRDYFEIFYRPSLFDSSTYQNFGIALYNCWCNLKLSATEKGELERYQTIEQPVSRYLMASVAKGISIDTDRLREHKRMLEHDFYIALKNFSSCYNLPLEVPDDQDVIDYLEPLGFDFSGVDVDYVLNFVPMTNSFASDLLHLRKLERSRNILTALPLSKERIFPLADVFGSITSRIYCPKQG